jgi:hypothetical protein
MKNFITSLQKEMQQKLDCVDSSVGRVKGLDKYWTERYINRSIPPPSFSFY